MNLFLAISILIAGLVVLLVVISACKKIAYVRRNPPTEFNHNHWPDSWFK